MSHFRSPPPFSLRDARKKRGLSQAALAEALSHKVGAQISDRSVGQWERGECKPIDRRTLVALFGVLHGYHPFSSQEQINLHLQEFAEGALQQFEIEEWFPDLTRALGKSAPSSASLERATPVASVRSSVQSDEDPEWYRRLILALGTVQEAIQGPEHHGMIGAIGLAAWAIGSVMPSGTAPLTSKAVVLFTLALWASSFLLALPPGRRTATRAGITWWERRVLRLSGSASGVTVAVALLLWVTALAQLLFRAPLPLWLNSVCALGAAIFAYAAGLECQSWLDRRPGRERGQLVRMAGQITLFMLLAQGITAGFLHFSLQELGERYWQVVALAPFALAIWHALVVRKGAREQSTG